MFALHDSLHILKGSSLTEVEASKSRLVPLPYIILRSIDLVSVRRHDDGVVAGGIRTWRQSVATCWSF